MKTLFRTALATLALAMTPVAQADYVLVSQDVTFTFTTIDADSFSLRIQNFLSASGDWSLATHLAGLGFKDIGPLTGLTGVTVTGPGTWTYSPDELNANGCFGGASGGICLDASPGAHAPMTDDTSFIFDLLGGATLGPIGSDGPHLKVLFTDGGCTVNNKGVCEPNKIGTLLSQNMPASSTSSSTGSGISSGGVPEPNSNALALLALGLMGLGFKLRSKGSRK